MVWGLSIGAAITGALCIGGKYNGSSRQHYVFKPLTTVLLLALAFFAGAGQSRYGLLVAGAIVFSLFGDVFLMLPKDHFLHGLLSFLVAHLFLITAFTQPWPGVTWWLLLAAAGFGIGMFALLFPQLGRMKAPVALYIALIGTMTWVGCERWFSSGSISGLLAGIGAILFLISDSTLGLNRFRASFRSADFITLSTYYLSLWLIALSVSPAWM